jgi:hypothetical protein
MVLYIKLFLKGKICAQMQLAVHKIASTKMRSIRYFLAKGSREEVGTKCYIRGTRQRYLTTISAIKIMVFIGKNQIHNTHAHAYVQSL